MNYSQMSYAKLHQMESWPTEGVTVFYNTVSDARFIIWDKNIQIIANLSVKNIANTTSLDYCRASFPSLCHSVNLILLK